MNFLSKRYNLIIIFFLLLLVNVFLFWLDYKNTHRGFTFAMLDVGQGDALFIESPSGTQVLFDGGPPRKILGPLSKLMSPFDRSIDAIIITNPDTDHIGGFIDVLKKYKVGVLLQSGTVNDTKTFQNLKNEIKRKNIPDIVAHRGMRLDLGDGVFIEILFPDRDVVDWSTNDGSIVARLTYGETEIMLTGDATTKTEKIILSNYDLQNLKSDILKVGHHGSRTSTSAEFVKAVAPTHAFISDGKNNRYGHPNKEVLDLLSAAGATILRTDEVGNIIVNSDGKYVSIEP
jgi:competence protein ComEC